MIDRIQIAFLNFRGENPHVYNRLVEMAREYQRAGKRVGIACLWEVLRYKVGLETSEPTIKLPNNYRSRYAREIMEREPDLAGFFRTAELRCVDAEQGRLGLR